MGKALVAVMVLLSGAALANGRECPRGFQQRTPEEVLADHQARLAAGDVEGDVRCNYAKDAVVISDGGIDRGRDQIFASLSQFEQLFGGQVPVVTAETSVSILNDGTSMVRLLFTLSSACIDVPDGADTYVIQHGQIQAQTSHAFPVFKCLPPP